MSLILNIETSSDVCSVCISRNGSLLAERTSSEGTNHASMLTVFIQELFQELQLEPRQIDCVAVSAGPGSYTGLRIGVVTAKGICYTLSKPLIALDTLQVLAVAMQQHYPEMDAIYCPTIDARRNEIYFGLYDKKGETLIPASNVILTEAAPFQVPLQKKVIVAGSGSSKIKWNDPHFVYADVIHYSSAHMVPLATQKFEVAGFVNTVDFQPHYVKPVHITQSEKQKI